MPAQLDDVAGNIRNEVFAPTSRNRTTGPGGYDTLEGGGASASGSGRRLVCKLRLYIISKLWDIRLTEVGVGGVTTGRRRGRIWEGDGYGKMVRG